MFSMVPGGKSIFVAVNLFVVAAGGFVPAGTLLVFALKW
jgi:hypothetical protein